MLAESPRAIVEGMRVLRVLAAPYGARMCRRMGYVLLALPAGLVTLVLAVVGRGHTAARWQRALAERLGGVPPGTPATHAVAARAIAVSLTGIVVGALAWVVAQWTAFILLINVAFPWREYLISPHTPDNAPLFPWFTVAIHRPDHPVHIWASTYYGSWGGPTVAGAWAVHAGLCLLVLYPVIAWLVRGLAGVAGRLSRSLLRRPSASVPANGRHVVTRSPTR